MATSAPRLSQSCPKVISNYKIILKDWDNDTDIVFRLYSYIRLLECKARFQLLEIDEGELLESLHCQ